MKRVISLLVLVPLFACQDQGPTALTAPTDPSATFSDAVHNDGNERFYLLPPMVKNPAPDGVFNHRLQPRVAVCVLAQGNEAGCESPIADFTVANGISIPEHAEHYQVEWNTSTSNVALAITYRILFYLTDQPSALLLGFADVQFGSNMRDVKNVQTGETIGLVDGRSLPLRFRIEQGASCAGLGDCGEAVVGPDGGVVTTVDGHAGVSIPAGAVDEDILITITQVDPSTQPWGTCLPTGLRQEEGCYKFDTDPAIGEVNGGDAFNEDVTVGVCLDPGALRPGKLTLHKYDPDAGTGVLELPNSSASFLDCSGFSTFAFVPAEAGSLDRLAAVTGRFLSPIASLLLPRTAFATDLGRGGLTDAFSFVGWAESASLSGLAPAESAPGAVLYPLIQAVTAHNHPADAAVPASGATLRFEYTTPDGQPASAGFQPGLLTTDAAGQATAAWQLTMEPGLHTLTVSTRGEALGHVVPDPTTLLVLETTVSVAGVFCSGDPECGDAVVGPGGGVVITASGHAGVSIPEGALDGPLRVTVRRVNPATQPWGKCLPTGLRQEEGCYEFDTDPAIGEVNPQGTFNLPVTVAVCLDPAAPRQDKLTLHRYDPDQPQQGVLEMQGTQVAFLECANFTASGPGIGAMDGPLRWLAAAGRRALSPARNVLIPRLAYATDLGRGGLTDAFSFMGWAGPVQLSVTGGNLTPTASPGASFTIQVKAETTHNHSSNAHVSNNTVLYAEYTDPSNVTTVLGPFNSGNAATTGINWTLTQAVGTHTAIISTRGLVNSELVPDPTMPLVLQVVVP